MFKALTAGSGTGARWPIAVLAAGFLVLVAVAAVTAWQIDVQRRQSALVTHTMQVQTAASDLLIAALNAETGQRGYVLTGGSNYFAVYEKGLRDAPHALARLRQLTSDNADQQRNLARITPLLGSRLAFLQETAEAARAGRGAEAIAAIREGRGKRLMDRLRVEIGIIQAQEAALLRERQREASQGADLSRLLGIGGLFLAVAMAFGAILSMLRYARGLEGANTQVRALNEGLEDIVAERTADLQAANDEIQRFAYIVSHDLRSPLVNVMGFTAELDAAGQQARTLLDAIEADRPDLPTRDQKLAIREDLPEALGFIRTSTAKMDRLINAILKLSREGRRTLAPERIDMTAFINDIVMALHQQAEAAGATVTVAALPSIVSDRLALDQIFGNLIENALKYLAPGRPGEVEVIARPLGGQVQITVSDNGRGIDKADQERVFDLFRRAGVQDRPGEGIGLAHVRALVRRLGGSIDLESELGRGSRFIVTLPRELKESAGV